MLSVGEHTGCFYTGTPLERFVPTCGRERGSLGPAGQTDSGACTSGFHDDGCALGYSKYPIGLLIPEFPPTHTHGATLDGSWLLEAKIAGTRVDLRWHLLGCGGRGILNSGPTLCCSLGGRETTRAAVSPWRCFF